MKKLLALFLSAAAVCCCTGGSTGVEDPDNGQVTTDDPSGPPDDPGYDLSGGCPAIDLGLSVKWAAWNIGAKDEKSLGTYFAWGETAGKSDYSWGGYAFGNYNNVGPDWGLTHPVDSRGRLLPENDPATKLWGKRWRTPTRAEMEELCNTGKVPWIIETDRNDNFLGVTVCRYITVINSLPVPDVRATSNRDEIFLPVTGYRDNSSLESSGYYGLYWTSSLASQKHSASSLMFSETDDAQAVVDMYRNLGMQIRAVTDD